MSAKNSLQASEQQKRIHEYVDDSKLIRYEIFWSERFSFFESHGYRLRPRLRPGWIPSWHTTNVYEALCEDNVSGPVSAHCTCWFNELQDRSSVAWSSHGCDKNQ